MAYVSGVAFNGASASSYAVTFASTAGNALVVGILLVDGSKNVLGVTDNVGSDSSGVPFNTWQRLGVLTNIAGERIEMWGAVKAKAVTTINIVLSGVQGIQVLVEQYSGFTAFGPTSVFDSTSVTGLNLTTTFAQNSDYMVSLFGLTGIDVISTPSGTLRHQNANFARFASVDNTSPICGVQTTSAVRQAMQAISVTLVASLNLVVQPGFSDVPDSAWVAGQGAHGLLLNRIAQNAALGMCRCEFFVQTHVNGDTVDLPVSPIDSYIYGRDELYYLYTPINTFDPNSGWLTGEAVMFYSKWDVDADTGAVSSIEVYGGSGSHPKQSHSNDGTLEIVIIAQRRRNDLISSTFIEWAGMDLTKIALDKPLTQTVATLLNRNSKFAAANVEVIYLGEYIDGNQLPQPISPIDGRVYTWGETHLISTWLWTTSPSLFTKPPSGWDQAHRIQASISATGKMTVDSIFYNNIAIDPRDPPNGSLAFGRVRVYAFCQRDKGPYFNYAPSTLFTMGGPSTGTYYQKFDTFLGSTTGKLKISFAGENVGGFTSLDISKCRLLTTAKGSNVVTLNQTILFGGSASVNIPGGTVVESDGLSCTMDDQHDYYIAFLPGANRGSRYVQNISAIGGTPVGGWGWQLNHTTVSFQINVAGDNTGAATVPSFTSGGQQPLNCITALRLIADLDATVQNAFNELDIESLMPGVDVPYTTLLQLARNIQEGANTPEVFGPVSYAHGATVPTPVSPIDGYAYSRAELMYIRTVRDTGPNTHIRLVAFGSKISSVGLLNFFQFRLSDGGPYVLDHDGLIDVITVGVRANLNGHAASVIPDSTNPPSDAGSIVEDQNGGVTVNGV